MKIGDNLYGVTQNGGSSHYLYKPQKLMITGLQGVRIMGNGPLSNSVVIHAMYADCSGAITRVYNSETGKFESENGENPWFFTEKEALEYCIDKNMDKTISRQQQIIEMETEIIEQRKLLYNAES